MTNNRLPSLWKRAASPSALDRRTGLPPWPYILSFMSLLLSPCERTPAYRSASRTALYNKLLTKSIITYTYILYAVCL
jgi:hypothetical protein